MLLLKGHLLKWNTKWNTDYISESRNSPPLFCCCGPWDWVSTRRLCPMIQPQRGLYLSCTQKRALSPPRRTNQQSHLPSFLLPQSPVSFISDISLSSAFASYTLLLSFLSVLPPSLPLTISLSPSLPPGAGLPSPTQPMTLPPWLIAQVSIHSKMPTIPGRRMTYVLSLMPAVVCGPMCASNNIHKMQYLLCGPAGFKKTRTWADPEKTSQYKKAETTHKT